MTERIDTTATIAERDRVLTALDVPGVQAFIRAHGGHVTERPVSWTAILHMARVEATSLPDELRTESRVWLAIHRQPEVHVAPPGPALSMALDILFPPDLFAQTLRDMIREGATS